MAFLLHTQGGYQLLLDNHGVEPSPKIKELYLAQVRTQLASEMSQTHRGRERTGLVSSHA